MDAWCNMSEMRRAPLVDGLELIIETANPADAQTARMDTSTPAKKEFVSSEISVPAGSDDVFPTYG